MNMKMKNIYKVGSAALIAVSLLATGCSDEFLAEKRPYGSFGPEQVYGDWASVKLRLNYIYQKSLPYFKGYSLTRDNFPPDLWPVGLPDLLSANTDEFPGYGQYNDPINIWTNTNIHKYFYYGINESPWKKMRECTDVIVGVNETENSRLTPQQKHEVEAQARFFRATRYFRLFKRYGGVPIVRGLQSTLMGDRDSLAIARQSTEATYRFMIEDLKYGGEHLPTHWDEVVNDWGRITAGTCYALAGIIANYYASPVFNRADDVARWDSAYVLNKKALEVLAQGGFGLAYEDNPGTNASNWAKIWCNMLASDGKVSEGVYMAICNNAEGENDLYNCWEQSIRPGNANGGGGIEPTAEMVDAFPMADGKRPTEAGQYRYDKKLFFLNRDPRFYRTFAFCGTMWTFDGTPSAYKPESYTYPYDGKSYELWNYTWYKESAKQQDSCYTGKATDGVGKGCVYLRKGSADQGLNVPATYAYTTTDGFKRSSAPYMEIRFAEVLLNLAESAVGASHNSDAMDCLKRIRTRAGLPAGADLQPARRRTSKRDAETSSA